MGRTFVARRGQNSLSAHGRKPSYFSDRVPVRESSTVEGHAVRAMYLAAGATDVVLDGLDDADGGYLAALRAQWHHMVTTKTYLTGGLGSRWDGEAFGDPYELPPDVAYCETCAAIGSVQWSWRMLLATGEVQYADLIERTLYNGMLAGVSQSGDEYFYVNALQLRSDAGSDDHRHPANGRLGWFDVACCPPNIMRTVASIAGYVATESDAGVQLHQYTAGTIAARGGELLLRVATEYPWNGTIEIEVERAEEEWELALRIPQWCVGATVALNGEARAGRTGLLAQLAIVAGRRPSRRGPADAGSVHHGPLASRCCSGLCCDRARAAGVLRRAGRPGGHGRRRHRPARGARGALAT